jgi:transposase
MTDDEWAYFEPFLIHRGGGRPPRNHRRVLDAVFWLMRTGAPWRDLPEGFGNWNSIFRQFRRWADSGVWDVILEGLAGSGVSDAALQMIDATIIRAHHCAAGGKVWPAPSASGFCSWPKTVCTNVSGLSAMPLTKMEIRAFCSS